VRLGFRRFLIWEEGAWVMLVPLLNVIVDGIVLEGVSGHIGIGNDGN
jgi:hypothetical protein